MVKPFSRDNRMLSALIFLGADGLDSYTGRLRFAEKEENMTGHFSLRLRVGMGLLSCLFIGSAWSVVRGQTPEPPDDSGQVQGADCCVEHGYGGCGDLLCSELVCLEDFFCCDFLWIQECADLAAALCGNLCDSGGGGGCPGPDDCCTAHPETTGCNDDECCTIVCDRDPVCCDTAWDEDCEMLALLFCPVCAPAPECSLVGDCCSAHAGGGCERSGCCENVCGADPSCCTDDWSQSCAGLALEVCGAVCGCPAYADLDQDRDVDLFDTALFMNCFSGPDGGVNLFSCACAEYDGDGDVDLVDYPFFEAQITGP